MSVVNTCGKDLRERRFGKLVVKSRAKRTPGNGKPIYWECDCDCGGTTVVASGNLVRKRGGTKSCGCLQRQRPANYRGHEEITGSHWWRIRNRASAKNIPFEINIEYAWRIFIEQGRKCALTGVELSFSRRSRQWRHEQTASLDRKDSSKGYVVGNVQWVHKYVNVMKNSHGEDDFVEWCRKVVEHQDKNDHDSLAA